MAEDAVRTIVPGLVSQAVPMLVVVQRLHARPEGLEFILAETVDDVDESLYRALQSLGLCNRSDPATAAPIAGYFDSVFDPPLRGDPPVFGNP